MSASSRDLGLGVQEHKTIKSILTDGPCKDYKAMIQDTSVKILVHAQIAVRPNNLSFC